MNFHEIPKVFFGLSLVISTIALFKKHAAISTSTCKQSKTRQCPCLKASVKLIADIF
jgi:hypothetical protein